ncbi:hypothetical protein M758_3G200200 [Ceratodon purpureus]|nr:hypothetical protein M758_3G200200 [Ceratodon purpureus]
MDILPDDDDDLEPYQSLEGLSLSNNKELEHEDHENVLIALQTQVFGSLYNNGCNNYSKLYQQCTIIVTSTSKLPTSTSNLPTSTSNLPTSTPDLLASKSDSPTLTSDLPSYKPLPYVDINAKARENFEESKEGETNTSMKEEWLAKGFTPLHFAAWKGSERCVKLLLAEPDLIMDVETIEGFTPLHMAAHQGHEDVIHLILQEFINRKHERQMIYDENLIKDRDMIYMNHERDQRMLKFQDASINLKGNGPINVVDCMGRTPLHYAAQNGRLLTVRELLLWDDTYVNIPDANGMLAIHMAARQGHAEVVGLLLYEYHWGPTILKSHKQTMVTKPMLTRPFPMFQGLVLEILPRPSLRNAFDSIIEGSTPLHLSAIEGHIEVALKLLKYVDPTILNGKKQTPLDTVLQQIIIKKWIDSLQLIEMFKLLLVAMPKVTIMSENDVRLIETLRLERNSGRESLLWKLDAIHATHATLLHWAAAKGSAYLVQLLLYQPGIDINQVSSESEKFTSLHMAAKAGHTAVIRLLVAEKEKLRANEEDYMGRTALQIAAERNFASKHKGRNGLWTLSQSVYKKNPLEGIIEISWRDCEQLLLGREDVKGYLDLLYRDRQVFVDAANAILVGSALIATVTYNGWITPPLGYITYYGSQWELPEPAPPYTFPQYVGIEQYPSIRAFWIFNSLSFFFSMASVIASAEGILPVQGKFIKEAVQDARRAVAYASSLLVIAVVFTLGSFCSCGFAVLPPIKKWENYMTITICCGGIVTLAFTVRFILPVTRMIKPQYNTQLQIAKLQKFKW